MSNIDEITAEIERLEEQPLTYSVVEKLAMLYTVRDHLNPIRPTAEKIIDEWGDSEFLSVIKGKDAGRCWIIVDELITSVQAIYPRLYEAFIAKIT